ncbi:MAG TPA: hypothetical protein VMT58_06700 [Candidatus Binataceae bacterium]|nr:hypothetical protein [Candidatus Binataceae bacterium]
MTVCQRSLAIVAGTLLAASVAVPAFAGNAPKRVTLHVDSVLAAETNEPPDPKLGPMDKMLHGAFSYTSYHLVSHQDGETECGKMVTFTLPGGRILHVQPRAIDGDMIAMEIVLFDGARPMMTTDLKLKNNGSLIVGGQHYEQGMLIISIGASTGEALPPVPANLAGSKPQMAVPASAVPH